MTDINKKLFGKVVAVLDEYKIVINKGYIDGVSKADRFLVYYLGEEMFDPDTNESLGTLEIICGEGKPEHIQEHITTIVSCKVEIKKNKTIVKRNPLFAFGETTETIEPESTVLPFDNVKKGCCFKQIG